MAIDRPTPIFQGVTPTTARKALRVLIEQAYDKKGHTKFVTPCVGSFAMVEAAVKGGVKPTDIVASDITLYSSVLGYILDPTKSVEELKFEPHDPELKEIWDEISTDSEYELAAKILFCIHLSQIVPKKEWIRWQRITMLEQRFEIVGKYAAGLKRLDGEIGGLTYECRDAHAHVAEFWGDSSVWVWYNPPAYKGGYTKMFDPKGKYSWADPSGVVELTFKEIAPFVDELFEKTCTATIYVEEWYPIDSWQDGKWFVHYAEPYGKTLRYIHIAVNKADIVDVPLMARPKITYLPGKVPPVYNDEEITAGSVIEFVPCKREVALYFYDLFVRELGMTQAESYYLFMVDGRVAGTVGLFLSNYIVQRKPILHETFGLSPTSQRYLRLNRLLMRYLTSKEFARQVETTLTDSLFLPDLEVLQTTCLSKYPEVKVNRGILKLVRREKQPNGRFKLIYRSDFHDMTMKEVVAEWLKKHAKYSASGYAPVSPKDK